MFIENNIESCIEYLNKLQPLPSKGIIAGGSIANYLWSVKQDKPLVINDIDIYVLEYDEKSEKKNESKKGYTGFYHKSKVDLKPTNSQTVESESDYSHISLVENVNSYVRIINSTRHNLINYISYQSNKKDSDVLIDTFDINSTQIAYNLETKEVYYTDKFKEFLYEGRLKVVNPNTPSHTLLRILKKRDELDAYLDYNDTVEYLTHGYECRCSSTRHYFGIKKYYDLYDKYKEQLSINFDTIQYKSDKTGMLLTTLKPKSSTNYYPIKHVDRSLFKLKFYYNNIKGDYIKESLWDNFGAYCNSDSYLDDVNLESLNTYSREVLMINWFKKQLVTSNIFYSDNLVKSLRQLRFLVDETSDDPKLLKYILNYKKDNIFDLKNSDDVQHCKSLVKIKYRKNINNKYTKEIFSIDDMF